MSFENKIIVITGAGSGLGKALAIQFAKLGAKLAISDINKENLWETKRYLKKYCGDHIVIKAFDVANKSEYLKFVDRVVQKYDRVDILINNAGIALLGHTSTNLSRKIFEKVVNTNLWGTVNGCEVVLPLMKNVNGALIVNISSIIGEVPFPLQTAYAASKSAIIAYTKTLQRELVCSNSRIGAMLIVGGGVRTNIVNNAFSDLELREQESLRLDFNRILLMSPHKAAGRIIAAIRKRKRVYYLGYDAKIYNLLNRYSPQLTEWLILKMFKSTRTFQIIFAKRGCKIE